jgi:hypothetical protein
MSWSFTTQSRDCELIRPIQPQYGTIQRPRRLRLRSCRLSGQMGLFFLVGDIKTMQVERVRGHLHGSAAWSAIRNLRCSKARFQSLSGGRVDWRGSHSRESERCRLFVGTIDQMWQDKVRDARSFATMSRVLTATTNTRPSYGRNQPKWS